MLEKFPILTLMNDVPSCEGTLLTLLEAIEGAASLAMVEANCRPKDILGSASIFVIGLNLRTKQKTSSERFTSRFHVTSAEAAVLLHCLKGTSFLKTYIKHHEALFFQLGKGTGPAVFVPRCEDLISSLSPLGERFDPTVLAATATHDANIVSEIDIQNVDRDLTVGASVLAVLFHGVWIGKSRKCTPGCALAVAMYVVATYKMDHETRLAMHQHLLNDEMLESNWEKFVFKLLAKLDNLRQ